MQSCVQSLAGIDLAGIRHHLAVFALGQRITAAEYLQRAERME